MSAISCQKIISYKGIKIKVSKLSFDTLFILCSVEVAWSLDFLHSIQFGEKISNTSTKLMCSDFWWFLMNVISKYLFLEQFCQFSERVLKFFSKAGDSIHSFSSCTHIGALKTEWKCIFSWKSAYLYTSTDHRLLCWCVIRMNVSSDLCECLWIYLLSTANNSPIIVSHPCRDYP